LPDKKHEKTSKRLDLIWTKGWFLAIFQTFKPSLIQSLYFTKLQIYLSSREKTRLLE